MPKLVCAAVVAALACPLAASAAAVDYFLKLDGIDGESADAKHKGEIDVASWSWGVTQASPSNTGRASSRPCVSSMSFTKFVDKATPLLMANAVTGMPIPKATLTARKAGGDQQEYLKVELKDLLVSSYQAAGATSGVPTDQFSLDFSSMTVEYKVQKPDGSLGEAVTQTFRGGC